MTAMPQSLRRGFLFILLASILFATGLYSKQHTLLDDPNVRAAATVPMPSSIGV